ncbi:hypothetical protein GGR51DRAFT_225259 [Nemania sp. FL0031]|nr:hypothetical protein GGR51DRAFT_225259 [Nemania sp. FL0031]
MTILSYLIFFFPSRLLVYSVTPLLSTAATTERGRGVVRLRVSKEGASCSLIPGRCHEDPILPSRLGPEPVATKQIPKQRSTLLWCSTAYTSIALQH